MGIALMCVVEGGAVEKREEDWGLSPLTRDSSVGEASPSSLPDTRLELMFMTVGSGSSPLPALSREGFEL